MHKQQVDSAASCAPPKKKMREEQEKLSSFVLLKKGSSNAPLHRGCCSADDLWQWFLFLCQSGIPPFSFVHLSGQEILRGTLQIALTA